MTEPALDLAIVAALVSSYRDRPVDEKTVVFGEVGLSGEVRAVSMADQRVSEARRLGFTRCILPAANLGRVRQAGGMILDGVSNVKEAMALL